MQRLQKGAGGTCVKEAQVAAVIVLKGAPQLCRDAGDGLHRQHSNNCCG